MNNTEIICTAITGICSILVAIVSIHNKRVSDKMEQRTALRERGNMLSLQMMDATLQLSIVSSNALTGGHNNGNVERARQAAEKCAKDYEEFMRGITAHEISR